MRTLQKALLGFGLALGVAACSDYLSAPDVTNDPTKVTVLTQPGPLYIAIQEAGPPQREGQLARFAAEYTQQIAGNSRQQQGYDTYNAKPSDTDPYFTAIYGTNNTLNGGGGLLDIHKMQQLALKKGDSLLVGIGKVYEAMYIGLAADQFGDIPYREAADSTKLAPHFDPQLQIYGDLQTQLDSAINIFLAAAGPTNVGPTAPQAVELVYGDRGGSPSKLRAVYKKVAHSLKARLYMHTAEVDPTAYGKALAEVPLGIGDPADDFLWFHDGSANGTSIWWQFMSARGDIAPASAFLAVAGRLAAVDDSSLIKFAFVPAFATAKGDTLPDGSPRPLGFFGFRPGGTTEMPTAFPIDSGNGSSAGTYSLFGPFIDGASPPGDFRHPEITYAETQLIGAEAAWRINGGGADPTVVIGAAQPFLDAARKNRHYGSSGGAAITFGDAPGALPASLKNIIEEKYVTLFLNPEVWNDYKRTCLPSLASAPSSTSPGSPPGTTPIPGRLPYGLSEINANPNTPATSSTGVPITTISQNPNDPNTCDVLNYKTPVNGVLAN
jgi:hypothetical protein